MIFLKSLGIAIVLTAIVFGGLYGIAELIDLVDAHYGQNGVFTLFGSVIFGFIFLVVHSNSKESKS